MNTLFVGKVQYSFDELPSTNDFAVDLVAQRAKSPHPSLPEGTVVRAVTQSAGRGQYGSRWLAEPGKNLTLSLILYPNWLMAKQQFYFSMAISLGVLDALRHCFEGEGQHSDLKIKWPNDLYIQGKKVGGILIQNSLQGQFFQSSVVGIGINANQTAFAPTLPNPGSLAQFLKREIPLDTLADLLYYFLECRYLQLKAGQHLRIREDYLKDLYGHGIEMNFTQPEFSSQFCGIIHGVDEEGRLLVERKGEISPFGLKEITFVL